MAATLHTPHQCQDCWQYHRRFGNYKYSYQVYYTLLSMFPLWMACLLQYPRGNNSLFVVMQAPAGRYYNNQAQPMQHRAYLSFLWCRIIMRLVRTQWHFLRGLMFLSFFCVMLFAWLLFL